MQIVPFRSAYYYSVECKETEGTVARYPISYGSSLGLGYQRFSMVINGYRSAPMLVAKGDVIITPDNH